MDIDDKHPELTTGVYIDAGGRKWFCIRRPESMSCSSSGSLYTAAYLHTFKAWGWKMAEVQSYP